MVQLAAALLVIIAYVAASRQRLRFDSIQFLAMNTIGAAILAVVAALNGDFGFLLLETVWAWVAGRGLRKAVRAKKAAAKAAKESERFSRSARRNRRRKSGENPLRPV